MSNVGTPRFKSVVFDADSTLARLEGIDWLAAQRGAAVGAAVRTLTDRAMAGELSLDEVYEARLNAIRPSRHELAALAEAYIAAIEPGARELCARLHSAHVNVAIVSGGLFEALVPFARALGVSSQALHAVHLTFDAADNYAGLARAQALTTQNGKADVLRTLSLPRPVAMIGDGATDAAARHDADAFFAYTRVARRIAVVEVANAEAPDFTALNTLLFHP